MRILVTGGSGFLGYHVAQRFSADGHSVLATFRTRSDLLERLRDVQRVVLDLADSGSVVAAYEAAGPDVVVHCAAMPDLGPCQESPELAQRCNVQATAELADLTARGGGRFLFISTDQVFDGEGSLYTEADEPRPLHVYGQTKLDAERVVLTSGTGASVIRTALIYGNSPSGRRSASEQVVNTLRRGEAMRLFTDEYRTPVYVEDAAAAIVTRAVMETGSGGASESATHPPRLLHVAGPQRLSRYEFGVAVAEAAGLDATAIEAARQADAALPLPRPRDLSLSIARARATLPWTPCALQTGLRRCFERGRGSV